MFLLRVGHVSSSILVVALLCATGCASRSSQGKPSQGKVRSSSSESDTGANGLLKEGTIANEVKDLKPSDSEELKATLAFDSTTLTHCDAFVYADYVKKSWLDGKVDAGNKFLKGDRSPVKALIDHALSGNFDPSRVKKTASENFSAKATAECTLYLNSIQNKLIDCGQWIIADYKSYLIMNGNKDIFNEPFFKISPKGAVSSRTYKAQSGMYGQAGQAKKLQDELLAAYAHFEKEGGTWEGYPDPSGSGVKYCTFSKVKGDLNELEAKVAGVNPDDTGSGEGGSPNVFSVGDFEFAKCDSEKFDISSSGNSLSISPKSNKKIQHGLYNWAANGKIFTASASRVNGDTYEWEEKITIDEAKKTLTFASEGGNPSATYKNCQFQNTKLLSDAVAAEPGQP